MCNIDLSSEQNKTTYLTFQSKYKNPVLLLDKNFSLVRLLWKVFNIVGLLFPTV
jgi:hypothetical protein